MSLVLLAALRAVSQAFDPSWRMVSTYALGDYGWVLRRRPGVRGLHEQYPQFRRLHDLGHGRDAESDGMRVMRALLEEVRDDENLAERVLDRLSGERGRGE
jgi:hypothetical protein